VSETSGRTLAVLRHAKAVHDPGLDDEQVSAALGPAGKQATVSLESRLYYAGARGLLDIVGEIPGDPGTVLMVGHNPAFHQLVVDLTGRHEPAFPTAALAVIRLAGSWRDAAPGGGELVTLWTPHGWS
jgi:phosphohistidine phosphatase